MIKMRKKDLFLGKLGIVMFVTENKLNNNPVNNPKLNKIQRLNRVNTIKSTNVTRPFQQVQLYDFTMSEKN